MFFQRIDRLMKPGMSLTVAITKKENQLTVAVLPKIKDVKDEAQNRITPYSFCGLPADIDNGFFQYLAKPIEKTAGLLTTMQHYEKQLEEAARNRKAVKDIASQQQKEEREKKEKFDKFFKQAEQYEKDKKFNDAITTYKQALPFASEQGREKIEEKLKAIRILQSQGSLFGECLEPQEPKPTTASPSPELHAPEPHITKEDVESLYEDDDDDGFPENYPEDMPKAIYEPVAQPSVSLF